MVERFQIKINVRFNSYEIRSYFEKTILNILLKRFLKINSKNIDQFCHFHHRNNLKKYKFLIQFNLCSI